MHADPELQMPGAVYLTPDDSDQEYERLRQRQTDEQAALNAVAKAAEDLVVFWDEDSRIDQINDSGLRLDREIAEGQLVRALATLRRARA